MSAVIEKVIQWRDESTNSSAKDQEVPAAPEQIRERSAHDLIEVCVVPTGSANLASIFSGLLRCRARPYLARDAADIQLASHVVLPGVGAFGPAVETLRRAGWIDTLRARVAADKPTLSICLGMQLLCSASEEAPGFSGLEVLPHDVRRFRAAPRIPQMGWNRVQAGAGCRILCSGDFYFANAYALEAEPRGWRSARSVYGEEFCAGVERGSVVACQFHPELSGAAGQALMESWLRGLPSQPTQADAARKGLARRIIPCLDVRGGRVVKGVQFQSLRDSGDPAERASLYEQQGADELIILDVSATPDGRSAAVDTVARVRAALSIPLVVGGGVRSVSDAGRLLDAGADKVAVNSAAVKGPQLIYRLASRYGSQCVVVAVDAARRSDRPDEWEVVVDSGRRRTLSSAVQWCLLAQQLGAGEILLTSWDRDGTRSGYDLDLIARVAPTVSIPVIASGGAAGAEHMLAALRAGADAVLAAGIFHDGHLTVAQIKAQLAQAGVEVRP